MITKIGTVKREDEIAVEDWATFEWVRLVPKSGEGDSCIAIRKKSKRPLTWLERLALLLRLESK